MNEAESYTKDRVDMNDDGKINWNIKLYKNKEEIVIEAEDIIYQMIFIKTHLIYHLYMKRMTFLKKLKL